MNTKDLISKLKSFPHVLDCLELKADVGFQGELFQNINRIPTLRDVYDFFMAKAEAFGIPTLALYARYCYKYKERYEEGSYRD